ncbi:MAG TPA: glycosyltransferase, partial [Proteobacteria bacterium]|nr:glycosyltransferase [Pseudomonadota bacterium]
EDKIELIPHGTEITRRNQSEARRRLNLPESAKIILMFGFIERSKNIHLVVESLKKIAVKVPDVYLFIAGGLAPNPQESDREYLSLIRKKIDELGPLKSRVNFAGYFFPHQDMPDILASADVVLFPYCSEDRSASGAFHLALGAGKPTVAYRIPKFEELSEVCDELLVLPHNKKGLKRTIVRILTDDGFRTFATEQIERYAEKTSWKNIAKTHLDVYKSLL